MSEKRIDERVLIDLSEIPELHKQSNRIISVLFDKRTDIFQMHGSLVRVLINSGIRIEKINKYILRNIVSNCVRIIKNSECEIEKYPPH